MTLENTEVTEESATTISFSEQLHERVKMNHNQINLEAQLMQAKNHFRGKSKGELIKILITLSPDFNKSKINYLKHKSKSDIIALVIHEWLIKKQEEIALTKQVFSQMEKNKDTQEVKDLVKNLANKEETIDYETKTFYSLINLPETSYWDGTGFSEMLDRAIKAEAKTLITPDGSKYEIINNSKVISII
jgi:hypothetical protein